MKKSYKSLLIEQIADIILQRRFRDSFLTEAQGPEQYSTDVGGFGDDEDEDESKMTPKQIRQSDKKAFTDTRPPITGARKGKVPGLGQKERSGSAKEDTGVAFVELTSDQLRGLKRQLEEIEDELSVDRDRIEVLKTKVSRAEELNFYYKSFIRSLNGISQSNFLQSDPARILPEHPVPGAPTLLAFLNADVYKKVLKDEQKKFELGKKILLDFLKEPDIEKTGLSGQTRTAFIQKIKGQATGSLYGLFDLFRSLIVPEYVEEIKLNIEHVQGFERFIDQIETNMFLKQNRQRTVHAELKSGLRKYIKPTSERKETPKIFNVPIDKIITHFFGKVTVSSALQDVYATQTLAIESEGLEELKEYKALDILKTREANFDRLSYEKLEELIEEDPILLETMSLVLSMYWYEKVQKQYALLVAIVEKYEKDRYTAKLREDKYENIKSGASPINNYQDNKQVFYELQKIGEELTRYYSQHQPERADLGAISYVVHYVYQEIAKRYFKYMDFDKFREEDSLRYEKAKVDEALWGYLADGSHPEYEIFQGMTFEEMANTDRELLDDAQARFPTLTQSEIYARLRKYGSQMHRYWPYYLVAHVFFNGSAVKSPFFRNLVHKLALGGIEMNVREWGKTGLNDQDLRLLHRAFKSLFTTSR